MPKNILNSPEGNKARKFHPFLLSPFSFLLSFRRYFLLSLPPGRDCSELNFVSQAHKICSSRTFSFLLMISSFLLMFSCTTQKQLTYLNDIDEAGTDNFFPYERPEYRLQKQDILYVRFTTLNDEINNILNGGTSISSQSMVMTGGSAYLSGYTINDSGCINLPVIGDIPVIGKTMEETTHAIEDSTARHLKDTYVIVKLLSFKFTVLGEVTGPGTFYNYNKQLTVLDAIGMAGDITDYGDLSRILVVRPNKEGSHTYRIDLNKKEILSSEGYFLLPNDIVIVESLKVKFFNLNSPKVSFFISTIVNSISLTLLILTLL